MKTKISSFVDKDVNRTRGGAEGFPVTAERRQRVGGVRNVGRRFFMKSLAMGGALLVPVGASFTDHDDRKGERMSISDSDAAILRFLAAAEILETDLWQQYTEFANSDRTADQPDAPQRGHQLVSSLPQLGQSGLWRQFRAGGQHFRSASHPGSEPGPLYR